MLRAIWSVLRADGSEFRPRGNVIQRGWWVFQAAGNVLQARWKRAGTAHGAPAQRAGRKWRLVGRWDTAQSHQRTTTPTPHAAGRCDVPKREWSKASLGEVVDLLTGFPFKSAEFSDDPTNPRLLRGDNVVQGAFRWDGVKHWPKDRVEGLASYSLRAGDVIVAMDRPWIEAGLKRAMVRDSDVPALLVQRVSRLRAADDDVLDQGFLRYLIDDPTFTEYILAVQTGTSVPHISGAQIKGYEFDLPPLPEQRAIARVLGGLDDKIEMNRRMNRTLEDLARGLFRSWFVDFDPVTRNGSAKVPTAPHGLFPKRLVDSPLGPIPEGWRVGTVGELCDLSKAQVNPGEHPTEAFDHYSIPAFDDGRRPAVETGAAIKSNKFTVQPGCLLLSKLNPKTPRVWLPDLQSGRRAISSTEFMVCVPRKSTGATRAILFGVVTSDAFTDDFATLVTGTSNSHQRVRPGDLLRFEIVIPLQDAMAAADLIMAPWLERVAANIRESQSLAALRDALLPQLLSGEIRLREAERIMEGAAR